ncbi:hypothetical protein MMC26_002430 [Xylographa opegraphella]|nr:hypothetical protein [Xylographa opegraphella]
MTPNAGLTELYRGSDPVVDVVAVHGLNGDPFRTWTWTTEGLEKMWLKDPTLLPSNMKNSRILTYGYDAMVTAVLGKTSSDRILQHAQTLVAELVADREALAYSASRTSKFVQHVHSIYVSTFAILFLGTPHDGSNKAKLASVTSRMIGALVPSKVLDTDGQLINALEEGSEVLQNITDMFVPLMKNFHIFFFWEQVKTNMGITQDYVVEESSAAPIIDNTERAGLPNDHVNICKFESRTSPGYRLVVAALIRYSKEAPEVISQRWKHAIEMLNSKRTQEAYELLR